MIVIIPIKIDQFQMIIMKMIMIYIHTGKHIQLAQKLLKSEKELKDMILQFQD